MPTPFGVVLEELLVDHAERRVEPDLVEALLVHHLDAGLAVAVLGADGLPLAQVVERVAPRLVAAEVLRHRAGLGDRVERRVHHRVADLAADHVVLASVDLGPLDDPTTELRVEVPGEGVDRLVVVVVEVVDGVVDVAHGGAPQNACLGQISVGSGRPDRAEDLVAQAGDLLPRRLGRDTGYLDPEVQGVAARAIEGVEQTGHDRVGRGGVDQLVAAPVLHRRRRRVAAVHVDLVVQPFARWFPDPRAADEHAGGGAAVGVIVVDELAAALDRRQGVEQQAGAEVGGAPVPR